MIPIIISFVIGLLLIICAVIVFNKWGLKAGLLFLPPLIISIFLSDNGVSYLPAVIAPALIGAIAGHTFKNNKTLLFFIIFSAFSLTIVFTTNYYFLKYSKDIDLMTDSRENLTEVIKSSNISEKEKIEFLKRLDESLDIVKYVIPFTYFLNSIIFSFLCFYIIRLFFIKYLGDYDRKNEGIEFFKLNDYFIFTLIFGWLIVLLIDKNKNTIIYLSGLNIALIISILYFIQAIGILKFFMIKKGLPRFLILFIFLTVFLFGVKFFIFFTVILTSIGTIDFWADFRKLENVEKNNNL